MNLPILYRKAVSALCISFISLNAYSADVPASSSLVSLFGYAKLADSKYLSAQASYQADLQELPLAASQLWPQLGLSAQWQQLDVRTNFVAIGQSLSQSVDSFEQRLELTQSLFNYGQWLGVQRAGVLVDSAKINLRLAQQDLALRLVESWLSLLAARDQLLLVQSELSSVTSQFEAVNGRFELGQVSVTDLQEVTARLALLRAQVLGLESDYQASDLRFKALVGDAAVLLPSPSLNVPFLLPSLDLAVDLETQPLSNLNVLRSNQEVHLAQIEIQVSQAQHLPNVSLQATWTKDRGVSQEAFSSSNGVRDREQSSIGVLFKLPLYQGGRVSAQSNQLRQRLQAAQANGSAALSESRIQARVSLAKSMSALARLQALEMSVRASGSVLDSYQASYEVGLRTNAEVLDAQFNLRQAKAQWLTTKYELLLAYAQLKAALGQLDGSTLASIDLALHASADSAPAFFN